MKTDLGRKNEWQARSSDRKILIKEGTNREGGSSG
jgi:hypothetical protein